jgi:hypothetical protein
MTTFILIVIALIVAIPIAIFQTISTLKTRVKQLTDSLTQKEKLLESERAIRNQQSYEIEQIKIKNNQLSKYQSILNVEDECVRLRIEHEEMIRNKISVAEIEVKKVINDAKQKSQRIETKIEGARETAQRQKLSVEAEAICATKQTGEEVVKLISKKYRNNKEIQTLKQLLEIKKLKSTAMAIAMWFLATLLSTFSRRNTDILRWLEISRKCGKWFDDRPLVARLLPKLY